MLISTKICKCIIYTIYFILLPADSCGDQFDGDNIPIGNSVIYSVAVRHVLSMQINFDEGKF